MYISRKKKTTTIRRLIIIIRDPRNVRKGRSNPRKLALTGFLFFLPFVNSEVKVNFYNIFRFDK